jgi:hypothetical protein
MDEARVTVTAGHDSASLRLGWDTSLAEMKTRACEELGLGDEGWELQCEDGTTMMNKLERTLGELRDRRICPRREFELRRPEDAL